MNNIKNSRKSTQKVCRELKENKNSGLQDNTHFQTIGSSWKVKFVNLVISGDFEGGGRDLPTANFHLEYTHPGTVGSRLNIFGTLTHHRYGVTDDFMKTQKEKNFLEGPLLGSCFIL